jgi:uncharacterized membrane protein
MLKDKKQNLQIEIEKRLDNDLWDVEITSKIFRARKNIFRKKIAIISISVLILTGFLFSNYGFIKNNSKPVKKAKIYDFISLQVNNTYKGIFVSDKNQQKTVFEQDEIDQLIDLALSER